MTGASLAGVHTEVSQLMTLLAQAEGLSPALAARCARGHPKRRGGSGKSRDSYTPDEERRIVEAARHTVRNAAERIRGNHDLLRRWRDGERGLTSSRCARSTSRSSMVWSAPPNYLDTATGKFRTGCRKGMARLTS